MKKISLLLCLILLLTACDYESTIWVKNSSSQKIVVTAGYIPDTLLPEKPMNLDSININQSRFFYGSDVNDRYLSRLEKGEKLTLFVLSSDSVNRYSWKYLRENNVIFKRYELTAQDITKDGKINCVSVEVRD